MKSNISSIVKSPCKMCEERKENCHSNCKNYKKYIFMIQYYKNKLEKERELSAIAIESTMKYYKLRLRYDSRHMHM